MNEKAVCYLWVKSDTAKELMGAKRGFEEAIGNLRNSNPLNDFEAGLDEGLAKDLEMGAKRIKKSLLILLEEVEFSSSGTVYPPVQIEKDLPDGSLERSAI